MQLHLRSDREPDDHERQRERQCELSVNNLNQYTAAGNGSMQYDLNGNLTSGSGRQNGLMFTMRRTGWSAPVARPTGRFRLRPAQPLREANKFDGLNPRADDGFLLRWVGFD